MTQNLNIVMFPSLHSFFNKNVVGVCKTRTGYLRMADADGKMRIEKCGWKKKKRGEQKK